MGLYLWRAAALERFAVTEPSDLEIAEDTHVLRLAANQVDSLLVQVDHSPVGVDVPEDIHHAESYLKQKGFDEAH